MIPPNINRSDILAAIKRIDSEGIPADRHSVKWSVLFEGAKYPPKYLISLTNISANGEELLWTKSYKNFLESREKLSFLFMSNPKSIQILS